MDLLLQGIIGSITITSTEFIVGMASKLQGHLPMWDYSNMPLNFEGVICLPFSLLWIGVSIIGILIADAIKYYVFGELPIPYYKLFGKTIIKYKKKN